MQTIQQQNVYSTLTNSVSDAEFIQVLDETWQDIRSENNNQINLVSTVDRETWNQVDKQVTPRIQQIKTDFNVNQELTLTQKNDLTNIAQMIISAEHKDLHSSALQKLKSIVKNLFSTKGTKK